MALQRRDIRQAVTDNRWSDVEGQLIQLRELIPSQYGIDDEIRSWTKQITDMHDRAEQERRKVEVDRVAAIEAERLAREKQEQEQKRQLEEARLTELQRRLGLDAPIETLPTSLSLEDARGRLATLRAKIGKFELRLRAEYPALQAPLDIAKDTFESTHDYDARLSVAKAERAAVEKRYTTDVTALTGPYNSQITDLLARMYAVPKLIPKLMGYDADRETLSAKVGDYIYWFSVSRDTGRTLYNHQDRLRVETNSLEVEAGGPNVTRRIALNDSVTGERLQSRGGGIDVTGRWSANVKNLGEGQIENTHQSYLYNGNVGKFTIDLKTDGRQVTGSYKIGGNFRMEGEIVRGQVNADKLTFQSGVQSARYSNPYCSYTGTVSADKLELNRSCGGGKSTLTLSKEH